MKPEDIIREYYAPGTLLYDIYMDHAEAVTIRALRVAEKVPHMSPDFPFIEQAAMLHDIGIVFTRSKKIGCQGEAPYIRHGVLGRDLLDKKGYPRHGLVCERHVGVGLSGTDIQNQNLPLPLRDMLPISIEEKIICYADKFYSKNKNNRPKSVDAVLKALRKYGPDKGNIFLNWVKLFEDDLLMKSLLTGTDRI